MSFRPIKSFSRLNFFYAITSRIFGLFLFHKRCEIEWLREKPNFEAESVEEDSSTCVAKKPPIKKYEKRISQNWTSLKFDG